MSRTNESISLPCEFADAINVNVTTDNNSILNDVMPPTLHLHLQQSSAL